MSFENFLQNQHDRDKPKTDMGKIQEIVNDLKRVFPEVNKKGGWLTRSFYTLYGPKPKLDAIVCEDLKIHDNDFLFYYRFGDGTRLALTNTYIYFSGLPGNSSPEDMPTIRQVSHFHASPVTFPVFRANILKMIRVRISLLRLSGSMNRYSLHFEDFNEKRTAVSVQWAGDGELIYNNIVKLIQADICNENLFSIVKAKERNLDYDSAIEIYEEMGEKEEAGRVRKLKAEQGAVKVDQTVVHGNYVDDRDTIVKDSVINRSNVGGGSSKMQELKDLTEMKEKGLIDDDEFKQMKKEILGK